MAILLTIGGTHGIAAQAVIRRRKEIAVRLALGAPDRVVVRLITRAALIATTVGILIGIGTATAAGRLAQGLVFGLEPSEVGAYASAGLLLLTVALASSWWPTRQAIRVAPVETLRAE